MPTLDDRLGVANDAQLRSVLKALLQPNLQPAFCTLPKREIELLILESLIKLGLLSEEPGIYELVTTLKVTRSRARTLLYERELRRRSPDALDALVKQALLRPLLQKQGDVVALDVENPLVADHLRAQLRELGHTADGSFSPNLIRLSFDAAAAIFERSIPKDDRDKVARALRKAGVPDKSLKGALRAVLQKLAAKAASEAGEAIVGSVFDYLEPIMSGAVEKIAAKVTGLFSGGDGS